MGKCRDCGKTTFDNYQYCPQCFSAHKGDGRIHSGSFKPQQRPEYNAPGLGSDYLQNGYFYDQGYLREEIFTSEAELVAAVLSAKGMTSASLRRFYNKLRGIYARYKDNANFEEIKPGLYSFYPNVADAVARNDNVPEEFRRFINTNIKLAVKDPQHLAGFVEHFQSVLAYFKDNSNRRY
ncbi:type III-A CRISPR-associated protein Csm2 [Desulfotruncus alcoholivorax]|uniref:type III-A CRISPR-associated protein Csm2 n=1 Tax=Desulfotruncus alcoholivorax TaxID=265477 RepID=UPI00041A6AD6|nr:type III-A CRISPR-associated protein Csm2 [Desulfotruncus alcoholivorax]